MNLSVKPNEHVTFRIRHEDSAVVVVEKPARLVTQPGKGHEDDTLLNGLFARWGAALQNLGSSRDFGLLHRLDRDTSGLIVIALTASAYDAMREKFEGREVKKFYWAVTARTPREAQGVIRKPIAEFEGTREGARMKLARVSSSGKAAITAYRVLAESAVGALLECHPVTGRLHQVRVHLEAIGCPIVGDPLYGGKAQTGSRLGLHAHRLTFEHPVTGQTLDVTTGWPSDLRNLLRRLDLPRPDLRLAGEGGATASDNA